jgi:hypothetical protein
VASGLGYHRPHFEDITGKTPAKSRLRRRTRILGDISASIQDITKGVISYLADILGRSPRLLNACSLEIGRADSTELRFTEPEIEPGISLVPMHVSELEGKFIYSFII